MLGKILEEGVRFAVRDNTSMEIEVGRIGKDIGKLVIDSISICKFV